MKKILLLLIFYFSTFFKSFPQDIRGAEVISSYIISFQYAFDIYLYTQTSLGIDHSSMLLNIGMVTGTAQTLPNDITEWHYSINYTFPGSPGFYSVFGTDSFRIANIQNINNSSQEDISFGASIHIDPNIGPNNSPVFLNRQTELYLNGGNIVHNPNAYDPDGDSLSFQLVPTNSSTYTPPPGISIDSITGVVKMPYSSGVYAINIGIKQWRSGNWIVSSNREMLIDGNALSIAKEITNNLKFNLYPNPAHNTFNITSPFQNAGLKIYDMTGRVVQEEKLNSQLSTVHCQLSSGVYFVRVRSGEKVNVEKLVIE